MIDALKQQEEISASYSFRVDELEERVKVLVSERDAAIKDMTEAAVGNGEKVSKSIYH